MRERKATAGRSAVRLTAAVLAAGLMSMTCSLQAFAELGPGGPADEGKTAAELNGYSEAEWARLNDNVLEYDEIRGLVHSFNPSIAGAWNTYEESVREMQANVNFMNAAIQKAGQMEEQARRDYAPILSNPMMPEAGKQQIMLLMSAYSGGSMVLKATRDQMSRTLKNMSREVNGYNASLRQGEDQMVFGVQQLMIGYRTVLSQKRMLEQLVSLYEQSVEAANASLSVGMGTATDLMSAQTSLLSARSNLASLETTERQLRDQLMTMCGWSLGSAPEIGDVPAPDPARIASIDLEGDIQKACGNNYQVAAFRRESHGNSSAEEERRALQLEALRSGIRINLTRQYQEIQAAAQAYAGAQAGCQAALMSRNAAEVQYSQGLISKVQYLGSLITAIQQEAALDSARLALTQALETYNAAVAGNCDADYNQ